MTGELPEDEAAFSTEAEAEAEADRRNVSLRGTGSEHFYVAAFVRADEWRVERRGGPVPFKDLLRHAVRPGGWAWWPWNR